MRHKGTLFYFLFCGACLAAIHGCATVPPVHEGGPMDVIYRPQDSAALMRYDTTHIIGPAETVYRISKMYDVPIDAILKANSIKDPRELRIGQKIVIPDAAPLRPVIPIFKSNKWRYIVIHHSVTDEGDAMSLDVIHRHRGFNRGLGYHFVIDNGTTTKVDGQIEASPRWVKQMDGAHCNAAGMNRCGIGICLVGDFTYHEPTARQMDSLVLLVSTLCRYYHIPFSRVIGHRDVPGKVTACPGNSFPWKEFKRRLRRGR